MPVFCHQFCEVKKVFRITTGNNLFEYGYITQYTVICQTHRKVIIIVELGIIVDTKHKHSM